MIRLVLLLLFLSEIKILLKLNILLFLFRTKSFVVNFTPSANVLVTSVAGACNSCCVCAKTFLYAATVRNLPTQEFLLFTFKRRDIQRHGAGFN